jgi:hypothetical protein
MYNKELKNIRSKAKVTGSTANSALGLDKLKHQKEHFDCVMAGNKKITSQ